MGDSRTETAEVPLSVEGCLYSLSALGTEFPEAEVESVRPQAAVLPHWSLLLFRQSGADGIRTRDLSLDRAAC